MNKSVHKHRAEIARPISPVFHRTFGRGIFARYSKNKVFVSRDERGRGK